MRIAGLEPEKTDWTGKWVWTNAETGPQRNVYAFFRRDFSGEGGTLELHISADSLMGGSYVLVVPGAVGRPQPYDSSEFQRSAETLRLLGGEFERHGIRAAIEPIRSAEVSFCHTIADAKAYIRAVDHPAIGHINGDVYHMQSGEPHIGEAIVEAGSMLANLHMADSNRCALGEGSMDIDTLIMALYLIGFNRPGCYVTPEPFGPGGDPYPAMHGRCDPAKLDHLVLSSAAYFRDRGSEVLGAQPLISSWESTH